MKTIKFYTGISLLTALFLFSGCGKELDEIPAGGSGTESPENPAQEEGELLRLRVSDAGYLDAGTGSRATDSGLTTTFDDGDKIGLFVVNNENEVLYANVPYEKKGEEWTATQPIRTKGYPVRIFAYYPYVEDDKITEKVDATAADASAFFASYIEGLDISNQSTLADYRQADVMACMVTIDNAEAARKELTLKMNHLMGLVVVKLPTEVTFSVTYYLKDDESYEWTIPDVKLPANLSDESFTVSGIQPLKEETGYRYLCKSGEHNISFNGVFTTYERVKSYRVSDATVSAGSSKTYNVSVPPLDAPQKVEHILQVGDFYMEDGSILPWSDTSSDKADCVGIVFWLGDPTATDPVLQAAYPKCTHGLVVSLKEVEKIQWQPEFDFYTTIQSWAESQSFYASGGYKSLDYNVSGGSDNPGEIQGYNNTEILKLYNSSHSSYPVTVLSCFSTITSGVNLPGGKTSGWYLPSPKELVELHNAESKVNASLSALSSTTLSLSNYWSSGEYSGNFAWGVFLRFGYVYESYKYNNLCVRLAFAF